MSKSNLKRAARLALLFAALVAWKKESGAEIPDTQPLIPLVEENYDTKGATCLERCVKNGEDEDDCEEECLMQTRLETDPTKRFEWLLCGSSIGSRG